MIPPTLEQGVLWPGAEETGLPRHPFELKKAHSSAAQKGDDRAETKSGAQAGPVVQVIKQVTDIGRVKLRSASPPLHEHADSTQASNGCNPGHEGETRPGRGSQCGVRLLRHASHPEWKARVTRRHLTGEIQHAPPAVAVGSHRV
jgi:hypothetical protein